MSESLPPREPDATDQDDLHQPRVIDATGLFQGEREVWIEHDSVRYRLRITRRNKLILQK